VFAAALIGLFVFTATACAKTAPRSFFGVAPAQPQQTDFPKMQRIGLGSTRVLIPWRNVQSGPGEPYRWHGTDNLFRGAAIAGLRPTPVLFGMPAHLNRSDNPLNREPPVRTAHQRSEWRAFAAAALDRYGPGGVFWQENPELRVRLAPDDWIVWNEQNAPYLWRPKPSPAEYAKLLRATRHAFDGIDPAARIVVGGMYGHPPAEGAIDAKPFLERVYRRQGMRNVIDGVSVHPFAGGVGRMHKQLRTARRVMNRAGDRKSFLMIGEIGWASGGPKGSRMVKNKRRQAELLRKALRVFVRERRPMRIKRVFWYTLRDYQSTGCPFCSETGLFHRDGSLKPAGRSYKKIVNRFAR
jgi:polysaccharide biosynthesis protein PslG